MTIKEEVIYWYNEEATDEDIENRTYIAKIIDLTLKKAIDEIEKEIQSLKIIQNKWKYKSMRWLQLQEKMITLKNLNEKLRK